MMTSSAYRQVSTVSPQSREADPENDLLSRMPLRRLDAEELRDTLIFVAGQLDQRQFGRADAVSVRGDGLVTSVATDGTWRRSIYLKQRRKEIATLLETFDLPQMNPNCRLRVNSTVAQQALHLLNDEMVRGLAASFAEQVGQQTIDPLGQIERVYQTALGRPAQRRRTPHRQRNPDRVNRPLDATAPSQQSIGRRRCPARFDYLLPYDHEFRRVLVRRLNEHLSEPS